MKKYPYKAWTLMPSFKPAEIEIESLVYGSMAYEVSGTGKYYAVESLFETKKEAIEDGHKRLEKQQLDLDKKQLNISKRKAALLKAQQGATE